MTDSEDRQLWRSKICISDPDHSREQIVEEDEEIKKDMLALALESSSCRKEVSAKIELNG